MRKFSVKKYLLIFFLTLFIFGGTNIFAQNSLPLFKPATIRALIFSGRNNHDWRTTTPFLKKILLDTERFDVRVSEEPAGTSWETLSAYDVLVFDYNGPRLGEVTENAIERFVKSGRGLVTVHGAVWAFNGLDVLGDNHKRMGIFEPPWSEFVKMTGGSWSLDEPESGHGQRHTFKVKLVGEKHPITDGMKETFLANDELYHNLRVQPHANILATAYDSPKIGGTGTDEPMLWTVNYGNGRVFYTALGHDVAAMSESGFITTFVRGCEWAARGVVTLPPEITLHTKNDDALNILVVTGGHSYDTEFYSVFEGYDDLNWDHAVSNNEAFRTDIRKQYEVVVLYDMSATIGEKEKKNLVNYVESGKGIIVLHHAVADYTEWEWWYKDVVGGKYLLKPDMGMPASTYKHDVELNVRPVGKHPILSGLYRMHIWDETYKGMWISPDVQVILETDNPTSDGPVAWISPYKQSKVVCIQLGHDRLAHLHPGFRKLVKNAIFWSAGKLK